MKNKKIFFLILSLFCTQKAISMETRNVEPGRMPFEVKELVIYVPKKINPYALFNKYIEKNPNVKTLKGGEAGYGCARNFDEDGVGFSVNHKKLINKKKLFVLTLSNLDISDKKFDHTLSIKTENCFFSFYNEPIDGDIDEADKESISKNKITKCFKILLIEDGNKECCKSIVFSINKDLYKNINNIFETKAYQTIDKNFCLKLCPTQKEKLTKNFKKISTPIFSVFSVINKTGTLIVDVFDKIPENMFNIQNPKELPEDPIYKEISDNISKAIKILDKDEKTLEDYFLLAKTTNNKHLCRSIINSCFIVKDLKNYKILRVDKDVNIPGEIIGLIISFAGIKSLAGEKLLVSKEPEKQENRI